MPYYLDLDVYCMRGPRTPEYWVVRHKYASDLRIALKLAKAMFTSTSIFFKKKGLGVWLQTCTRMQIGIEKEIICHTHFQKTLLFDTPTQTSHPFTVVPIRVYMIPAYNVQETIQSFEYLLYGLLQAQVEH